MRVALLQTGITQVYGMRAMAKLGKYVIGQSLGKGAMGTVLSLIHISEPTRPY